MMLGEVGGLNDFFALVLQTIFGLFSEQFLLAQLMQKLFRVASKSDTATRRVS